MDVRFWLDGAGSSGLGLGGPSAACASEAEVLKVFVADGQKRNSTLDWGPILVKK